MSRFREARRVPRIRLVEDRGGDDAGTLRVKDIMNRQFVTVAPEMLVGDLVDLLQVRGQGAAPVVDAKGNLLGIAALDDILRGVLGAAGSDLEPEPADAPGGAREAAPVPAGSIDPWSCPVADLLFRPDRTVTPDMPVNEVCRILLSLRVHHLPVVKRNRVVGLVSSLDLCRAVVEGYTIRPARDFQEGPRLLLR